MALYHTCRICYRPGEEVRIQEGKNDFCVEREKEGKSWIEDALEHNRPESYIGRREAIYAFDRLCSCWNYAIAENQRRWQDGPMSRWFYYEVDIEGHTRHPICLVDLIGEIGPKANCEDVAAEYWSPTHEWLRYEYFGSIMRVIKQVKDPDLEKNLLNLNPCSGIWAASVEDGERRRKDWEKARKMFGRSSEH